MTCSFLTRTTAARTMLEKLDTVAADQEDAKIYSIVAELLKAS